MDATIGPAIQSENTSTTPQPQTQPQSAQPTTQPAGQLDTKNFIIQARQKGVKDADIYSYLQSKNLIPKPIPHPGIVDRTISAASGAAKDISDPFQRSKAGDISASRAALETGIRAAGAVASPVVGAVNDAVGGITDFSKKIGAGTLATKFIENNPIIRMMPQSVKDSLMNGGQDVLKKVSEAYDHFSQKHPEAAKDLHAVSNVIQVALLASGEGEVKSSLGGAASDISSTLEKKSVEQAEKALDTNIEKSMAKGIKPSAAGRQTEAQIVKYNDKAKQAVKSIIENKDKLSLMDHHGEVFNGKLPESVHQFSQAIDQTKKGIFDKYDAMTRESGEQGAKVSLEPIAKELETAADSKVLQTHRPDIIDYMLTKAKSLRTAADHSPGEAQDAIKLYNDSLDSFYKNPSYESASKASVDALIANYLRSGLDSTIENTAGKGYQALKNQYGALRSIEKDVAKRAQIVASKNVSGMIPSFGNIMSGAELAKGLISMNPAEMAKGAVIKGISKYIEHVNSPDSIIKNMFKKAGKATEVLGKSRSK